MAHVPDLPDVNELVNRNALNTRDVTLLSTHMRRMEGFRVTFERVARIMAGRRLRVVFSATPPVPSVQGWTDGETIFLNGLQFLGALMECTDRQTYQVRTEALNDLISSMEGVVHHETAHLRYTPRFKSSFITNLWGAHQEAITNGLGKKHWKSHAWYAFNALEDQRIETLYTTRYSPIAPYFELMFMYWVIGITDPLNADIPDESIQTAYLCVPGRKYLPAKLVQKIRSAFIGQSVLDEVDRISNEYSVLALSTSSGRRRGSHLIREYAELISKLDIPDDAQSTNSASGAGNDTQQSQIARGFDKGEPDDTDQDDSNQASDAADDGIDNKESDSSPGSGSGDGNDEQDADDADGSSNAPSNNGKGGNGASTSKGGSLRRQSATIHKMASQRAEELKDGDSVDIHDNSQRTTSKALRYAEEEAPTILPNPYITDWPVKPQMNGAVNASIASFRRLNDDLDDAWLNGSPTGRLDMNAAMASDHDPTNLDVFSEWKESSRDKAGIEMVMCVDLSPSMGGGYDGNATNLVTHASQVTWIVKRVMQEIDGVCTVLGYDSESYKMYDRREVPNKTTWRLFDGPGHSTVPMGNLIEAQRLLSRSRKPNRCLLVVTDGAWGGSASRKDPQDDIIEAMGNSGIVTVLLGLGNAVKNHGTHKAQLAADVSSPYGIVDVVRALTIRFMNKALR